MPLPPRAEDLEPIGGIAWTPSLKTLGGDYDGDNEVDSDDYARWKDDYGNWVARGNGADGNGDGRVDAGDYTVWRNHLMTGGEIAASLGVPEASTSVMLMIGILLASYVRQKNHYPFRRTDV
jgi:hypothetical protein